MPGWGLSDATLTFEDLYPGTDAQVVLRDPRTITKADRNVLLTAAKYEFDERTGRPRITEVDTEASVRGACRVAAGLIRSWVMYDIDGNLLGGLGTPDEIADVLLKRVPEDVTQKILTFVQEKSGQGTVPNRASVV